MVIISFSFLIAPTGTASTVVSSTGQNTGNMPPLFLIPGRLLLLGQNKCGPLSDGDEHFVIVDWKLLLVGGWHKLWVKRKLSRIAVFRATIMRTLDSASYFLKCRGLGCENGVSSLTKEAGASEQLGDVTPFYRILLSLLLC